MNGSVLLDTNILVDLLRGLRKSRPKNDKERYHALEAKKLIEGMWIGNIKMYISCHTLKELLQYKNLSQQEEERINKHLPTFSTFLDTTESVARIAAELSRQSLEYQNHHVEDCYIAATAIAHQLTLYTRNPSDYCYVSHPKLRVIQPYSYHGAK